MELKNIFTFIRAAEIGNFTKAAEELGYSQSTVTFQIKQLEQELGFKLFDRIGKSVSITPYGEEFISYANEFLRLAAKVDSLGKTSASQTGTLRLGVIESLFVWKIADMLPVFHKMMPNVNIEIKSATGAALYRMLRQNELDLIYILDNIIYQKDCVRACTFPVSVKFVAPLTHPLVNKKKISLSEIVQETLILAERDAIYRRELDNEAAKKGIEVIPTLEVDNLEVVLRLLKKWDGISFMPDYVVKESVENMDLKVLDVSYSNINLWSQVVYHKNKYITPQMETLIELVRKNNGA